MQYKVLLSAKTGVLIALLLAAALCTGQSKAAAEPAHTEPATYASPRGEGTQLALTVDGAQREALVYTSASPQTAAPLVLVFHGHGGTARFVARRLRLHELWPQAIVAYLEGLPGVAGITDPEGKRTGWQKNPGELNDRDVHFVDAIFGEIEKRHRVDAGRVYALGHSNGARFVNVLWVMRGEKFAAFCSASAQGGRLLNQVKPRSIFMIAGERDPLVPYQGQLLSVGLARKVLRTEESKAVTNGYQRAEPGVAGTELVTYLHPGGHEFPEAAIPLVVEFFKRHSLRPANNRANRAVGSLAQSTTPGFELNASSDSSSTRGDSIA